MNESFNFMLQNKNVGRIIVKYVWKKCQIG